MLRSVAAAAIAALGLTAAGSVMCASTAQAASTYAYGVPVKSLTNSTHVGDVDSDHTINFYIPLTDKAPNNGVETYGKNNGGMTSDSCSYDCDGGSLIMYLQYTPLASGPAVITFDFTDLDLVGANDPLGFFESVEFNYNGEKTKVSQKNDSHVTQANDSISRVLLEIVVAEVLAPFTVKLVLRVEDNDLKKRINTAEQLKTYIKYAAPVPLPATLPLFATGLAVLGVLRWRRARPEKAAAAA